MIDFLSKLEGDAWGDTPPERVVVGDLSKVLRRWLPDQAWASWSQRRTSWQELVAPAGKAFVARDGKRTIAIHSFSPGAQAEFLFLFGHEVLESAMAEKKGADEPPDRALLLPRSLWGEYVVERRRRTISEALVWPASAYDHSHLCAVLDDYERELPALLDQAVRENALPNRVWSHWQLLMLEFAKASGRADAGFPAERAELQEFAARSFVTATPGAWAALADALRQVFTQPDRPLTVLDALSADQGFEPLCEALQEHWDAGCKALRRSPL